MTRVEIAGRFDLDADIHENLIAHARSDFPFEVCGLLAGPAGGRLHVYRIPNEARSMTFYNMASKPLLHAMQDIDDRDWELRGIYHSHTHTEAYPSATDVELAAYPDVVYVIVSLQDPDHAVIRAFDITDGRITERTVVRDGEEVPAGPR